MTSKDPYEVLGVSRNASKDEIRRAYMELVKKYHPDKYQGNPLADLAQEKLQEVNEAYDLLMKSSGAGNGASPYGAQPFSGGYAGGSAYGSGQAGYGSGNYGSYSSSSPVYNQIRSCINRGDIGAAERLLQSIPERSQEAEWLFLRGVISYSKGLIAEGISNVQKAMEQDPSNAEYRAAYNQMQNAGNMYRGYSGAQGYSSMGDAAATGLLCSTIPLCLCC
ncbi:MAG TPA: molecular chaperone DnaJ [Eubacterium sp.]|nr:molecular chaperone DnaJ [Eubacterium sp.]